MKQKIETLQAKTAQCLEKYGDNPNKLFSVLSLLDTTLRSAGATAVIIEDNPAAAQDANTPSLDECWDSAFLVWQLRVRAAEAFRKVAN